MVALVACGEGVVEPEVVATTAAPLTGQDGSPTISVAGTILNQYSALTASAVVDGTTLTVTSIAELDATAVGFGPLAAGDELMVIQMQGATISSADDTTYGTITALNSAGRYEFVNVASISGNTITITTADCGGLRFAYDVLARSQVVRVPQLSSLTISGVGSVVGLPWDGRRGGVVALHVGGTATVGGAGISASALGFRGGVADDAASVNGVTSFRTTLATQGGEKGESIAGDSTIYDTLNGRFGRGAPANGGGGGVAHNSGGGGGANGNTGNAYSGHGVMDGTVTGGASAWKLDPAFIANGNALTTSSGGGRGGYSFSGSDQDALTLAPGAAAWAGDLRREVGGRGGHPLDNDPAQRLFLGGGGGAGDGNNTAAGPGGAGGGLVFLIADTVSGTGNIVANGAAGANSGHDPGDAPVAAAPAARSSSRQARSRRSWRMRTVAPAATRRSRPSTRPRARAAAVVADLCRPAAG